MSKQFIAGEEVFPAGQQGEKLVIPEDLKTTCPLCSGLGKIKRGSFARPNTDITKACHNCHRRGWIWKLDQQEMAERIAELERQLVAITDQRDTLARQCNLNAQGVNAISGIIGERNEYKHELAEARKAALEEAARIADKIGEQAADGSDSLSSESIEEIHSWNDMQCHRLSYCFLTTPIQRFNRRLKTEALA